MEGKWNRKQERRSRWVLGSCGHTFETIVKIFFLVPWRLQNLDFTAVLSFLTAVSRILLTALCLTVHYESRSPRTRFMNRETQPKDKKKLDRRSSGGCRDNFFLSLVLVVVQERDNETMTKTNRFCVSLSLSMSLVRYSRLGDGWISLANRRDPTVSSRDIENQGRDIISSVGNYWVSSCLGFLCLGACLRLGSQAGNKKTKRIPSLFQT